MSGGKKEVEGNEMAEEKNGKAYPVKSLHDFLFELDLEWSKFRNGTLMGLISSGFMFVVVIWLILIARRSDLGIGVVLFLAAASVFLAYSVPPVPRRWRCHSRP